MSVTARMRREITRGAFRSSKSMQERTVYVTAWEAEVLVDIADDARAIVALEVIDGVGYCPGCRHFASPEWECGCNYGHVRAALARFDGEETKP